MILVSCGAGLPGWVLFFCITGGSIAFFFIKSYIKARKDIEKNRDFLEWQESEIRNLDELYEKDPAAYKTEAQKFEKEFERRYKS